MNKRVDLYISGDIEADGPIPGQYSMLAIGFAVAGRFDGIDFTPYDPKERSFYCELRPISPDFDSEALAVSRLDRSKLEADGTDPLEAMTAAARWVDDQAGTDRPVLVGFPVVFDWLFLHYYFVRFLGKSPFGFSGALDMKTIYQQKAGATLDNAGMNDLPGFLKSQRAHTHNALDDAVEQAEIFCRLIEWNPSSETT